MREEEARRCLDRVWWLAFNTVISAVNLHGPEEESSPLGPKSWQLKAGDNGR